MLSQVALKLAGPQQDEGTGVLVRNAGVLERKLEIARLGSRVQNHPPRRQIDDIADHRLAACGPDIHRKGVNRPLDSAQVPDYRDAVDAAHLRMHGNHIIAMMVEQLYCLVRVARRLRARPQDYDGLFLWL